MARLKRHGESDKNKLKTLQTQMMPFTRCSAHESRHHTEQLLLSTEPNQLVTSAELSLREQHNPCMLLSLSLKSNLAHATSCSCTTLSAGPHPQVTAQLLQLNQQHFVLHTTMRIKWHTSHIASLIHRADQHMLAPDP
jgi:hypothetical protein